MYLTALRKHWPVPGLWKVRSSVQGTDYLTRMLETDAGGYVMRTYKPGAATDAIVYEQTLIRALSEAGLPFAVPVPMAATSGDTIVTIDDRQMTMTPLIPGVHPERSRAVHATAAGKALGELVTLLEQITVATGTPSLGHVGELDKLHPLISDPLAALDATALDAERKAKARALLEKLLAEAPALYEHLPVQLVHRDFVSTNILVEGDQVSGVLDFATAGPDLRVYDLAYGICRWPQTFEEPEVAYAAVLAFCEGYLSTGPLTPDELEALPLLFQLRWGAELTNILGRIQEQVLELEHLEKLVDRYTAADAWWQANGDRLVQQINAWITLAV